MLNKHFVESAQKVKPMVAPGIVFFQLGDDEKSSFYAFDGDASALREITGQQVDRIEIPGMDEPVSCFKVYYFRISFLIDKLVLAGYAVAVIQGLRAIGSSGYDLRIAYSRPGTVFDPNDD